MASACTKEAFQGDNEPPNRSASLRITETDRFCLLAQHPYRIGQKTSHFFSKWGRISCPARDNRLSF
jgi:hypothetical protein